MTMNNQVKKLFLLSIIFFSFGFCFSNVFARTLSSANSSPNSSANSPTHKFFLGLDTEFCLVNSSDANIVINKVWNFTNSDWEGKFLPQQLINQIVQPNSASCWPLKLSNDLYAGYRFNIQIKTNSGDISWTVRQHEATGELYRKYSTLTNDTSFYLMQKAGDDDGFATNVFIVEEESKKQEDYLSNWMKRLSDNTALKDIQLIGAHDSGLNEEDGVECTLASPLSSITQSSSLATQLTHGVRYLDIRLEDGNNKKQFPYHKTLSFGCSSKKSFDQSLSEIINFIKTHDKETVLLKLSHTSANVKNVMETLDAWTKSEKTNQYFYKSTLDNYDWTNKNIGELRGKIVLLLDCEYQDFLNPEQGYFSFSTKPNKNHCDADAETQIVYDKYTDTLDYNKMRDDQLDKLNKPERNTTQLFLLSWTLTGGDIIAHTPRPAAYLSMLASDFGKTLSLPNIVYYDYEDPGINKILIANYEKLKNS